MFTFIQMYNPAYTPTATGSASRPQSYYVGVADGERRNSWKEMVAEQDDFASTQAIRVGIFVLKESLNQQKMCPCLHLWCLYLSKTCAFWQDYVQVKKRIEKAASCGPSVAAFRMFYTGVHRKQCPTFSTNQSAHIIHPHRPHPSTSVDPNQPLKTRSHVGSVPCFSHQRRPIRPLAIRGDRRSVRGCLWCGHGASAIVGI
jgi:hypothetical protein